MSGPAVTAIVPTFDRPERLAACLAALGRQRRPPGGLEILIADDGGAVDEAVASASAGGAPMRVVRCAGRGPAAARNRGAAAATAPLLAFTDDDCEPEPGWAYALWRRHEAEPGALIGGRTVNGLPANPYSSAAQAIADAALDHHNGGPGGPRFFPSNNVAVPAAAFREAGGFDERVRVPGGEDRDFCERWVEQGRPVAREDGALVIHSHELGLAGFWRQQAAYGAGARHHRRARALRGGSDRLEPSLTSGVFAIAARRALRERDARRLGLLGVWQAANLAGFARAALRERTRPAAS